MSEEQYNDLASKEVKRLQDEYTKKLESGWIPEVESATEVQDLKYRRLFSKIEYKWKPEDGFALTQIKSATKKLMGDIFKETLVILENLYTQIRIPETNEYGQVHYDESNRLVWKKDEHGLYKEDWDQLTGQDLEKALFDLIRVKLISSQRLADLFLDAVYAKQVLDDTWNEEYESVVEGTVGERTAIANRKSRQDKYFSYFRYHLFYRCNELQKELNNLTRILEKKIDWELRRTKLVLPILVIIILVNFNQEGEVVWKEIKIEEKDYLYFGVFIQR